MTHHQKGDEQNEPFPGDDAGRMFVRGVLGTDEHEDDGDDKRAALDDSWTYHSPRLGPEPPRRPAEAGEQPEERQNHRTVVGRRISQARVFAEDERPGDDESGDQHQQAARSRSAGTGVNGLGRRRARSGWETPRASALRRRLVAELLLIEWQKMTYL